MTDQVPPALKQADINLYKTASRAAQLATAKPIVAYWCEYWVVNQVLARNLHSTDADILTYTTTLMDRLEQIKNDYANEDAIVDDHAAQAYIEQFAQETLDRAERVIKANKVSQQTASTFDAALTFFNLVNIWGPPDSETQQKIKYAKWNAARIIKAIKEGRDPNESNPKREELPPLPQHHGHPQVQALETPSSRMPKPATVEDAPDADLSCHSAGVSLPQSPTAANRPVSAPDDDAEELKLPSAPGYGDDRVPASQPAYFDPSPTIPSPISSPACNTENYTTDVPPVTHSWSPTPPPTSSFSQPPYGPSAPPPTGPPTFAPNCSATAPPPSSPTTHVSVANVSTPANLSRPVIAPPTNPGYSTAAPLVPARLGQVPQQAIGRFTADDDMAMAQAQKHAKWAISALNFEDVPTAVRELRRALESLGAT